MSSSRALLASTAQADGGAGEHLQAVHSLCAASRCTSRGACGVRCYGIACEPPSRWRSIWKKAKIAKKRARNGSGTRINACTNLARVGDWDVVGACPSSIRRSRYQSEWRQALMACGALEHEVWYCFVNTRQFDIFSTFLSARDRIRRPL